MDALEPVPELLVLHPLLFGTCQIANENAEETKAELIAQIVGAHKRSWKHV